MADKGDGGEALDEEARERRRSGMKELPPIRSKPPSLTSTWWLLCQGHQGFELLHRQEGAQKIPIIGLIALC